MKKKILLVDESLTVQKVVALTLDKSRYALSFAKSRAEVMKWVVEQVPELILISDQMGEINAATFPKEIETWLGGIQDVPPVILITSSDIKEHKHYAGVLRKPFTPQVLQSLVNENLKAKENPFPAQNQGTLDDEFEDQRLHKIFNDTFADESTLMHETFHPDEDVKPVSRPPQGSPFQSPASPFQNPASPAQNQAAAVWGEASASLWDVDKAHKESANTSHPTGGDADSDMWNSSGGQGTFGGDRQAAPSNTAVRNIEESIQQSDLNDVVEKVLSRIVPPIVERLVRERLDKLLADQERFVELKQ
jgi:CheY-like chemotaxis protein